jgi:glycosyltransferase involved in cell wall biosynthesis
VRIWIAGSVLQSEWGGGEPIIARELTGGLRSRGFEVISDSTSRSMGQLASMAASPLDWDPWSYLSYQKKLDDIDPDCVLGFYDYDSALVRACVKRKVPYVGSVHIYWPVCPIGTLYIDGSGVCSGPGLAKCLRHMSRAVPPTRLPLDLRWLPAPVGLGVYWKTAARLAELQRAAALIVPSAWMVQMFESLGLTNVIEVPNGLRLGGIPSQTWLGGPKRILFASGAATERKGFTHFLAVAKRLAASERDVVFVTTGAQGGDDVVTLGRLSHDAVLREMREAYAIVAPSLWDEPFSVAIQEAMASGKPVIAYDVGGNAELLGDTGILVPRGDVNALCETVRALLRDEQRAVALGAKARVRIEAELTSQKMVDGYSKILQAVV